MHLDPSAPIYVDPVDPDPLHCWKGIDVGTLSSLAKGYENTILIHRFNLI